MQSAEKIPRIQPQVLRSPRFLSIGGDRYGSGGSMVIYESEEGLANALKNLANVVESYAHFGLLTPKVWVDQKFDYTLSGVSKFAFQSFGLRVPKTREQWEKEEAYYKYFVPFFKTEKSDSRLNGLSLLEDIDYKDEFFIQVIQDSIELYEEKGMLAFFGPAPFLELCHSRILNARLGAFDGMAPATP